MDSGMSNGTSLNAICRILTEKLGRKVLRAFLLTCKAGTYHLATTRITPEEVDPYDPASILKAFHEKNWKGLSMHTRFFSKEKIKWGVIELWEVGENLAANQQRFQRRIDFSGYAMISYAVRILSAMKWSTKCAQRLICYAPNREDRIKLEWFVALYHCLSGNTGDAVNFARKLYGCPRICVGALLSAALKRKDGSELVSRWYKTVAPLGGSDHFTTRDLVFICSSGRVDVIESLDQTFHGLVNHHHVGFSTPRNVIVHICKDLKAGTLLRVRNNAAVMDVRWFNTGLMLAVRDSNPQLTYMWILKGASCLIEAATCATGECLKMLLFHTYVKDHAAHICSVKLFHNDQRDIEILREYISQADMDELELLR